MIVNINKFIVGEFSLHTALVFSQLNKDNYTSRSELVTKLDGFVAKRTIYQSLKDLEQFAYITSKSSLISKNGKKFNVLYKIR